MQSVITKLLYKQIILLICRMMNISFDAVSNYLTIISILFYYCLLFFIIINNLTVNDNNDAKPASDSFLYIYEKLGLRTVPCGTPWKAYYFQ